MRNEIYDALEKIAGTLLGVVRELKAHDEIQKEALERLNLFFNVAPHVYHVGPPEDAFPVPDPDPPRPAQQGHCNTCIHVEDNGDKKHSWWCTHRPNRLVRVQAKHTCKHYA
jgi:hypothetical protein